MNAQILEGYAKSKAHTAKNRAVYDADKEVDSQINSAVDKQFNKLKSKVLDKDGKEVETQSSEPAAADDSEQSSGSSKSSNSSSDDAMAKAMMGKLGINMTRPANMKDIYEYTGNILMDMQAWDEDGKTDGVVAYNTRYSDKDNGFAMEFKDQNKGNSTMIFDYDNKLMLILSNDGSDKTGIATPLNDIKSAGETAGDASDTKAADEAKVQDYYSNFKKTGKTKTIAGYKCDEYYYEDEEDMVSYWMTNDLSADLWGKMYSSNIFNSLYTGRTNGFVMESDYQKKGSKERSHMIVKEVNPKQSGKISTVGYNVMTMNISAPSEEPKEKEKEKK